MKNKIFYLAAMVLGLVMTMTFITCEKNQDVQPQLTMQEPLLIPTEFSSYVTPEDVEEMYMEVQKVQEVQEVQKERLTIKGWKMIPVSINMRNTVTFEFNNNGMADFQSPATVLFKGTGNWDELGDISYSERIPYPLTFTQDWRGTGTMTLLKTKATKPLTNELEFISGFRTEKGVVAIPGNSLMPAPSEVIESVIEFTDGTGFFNDSYGKAKKVEMYFGDKNYCNTYIYGSVWVRQGATAVSQIPTPLSM